MKKIYLDKNKKYFVYAGSFVKNYEQLKKIDNLFTINLTQEFSHLDSYINIKIEDFSVPEDLELFEEQLKIICKEIIKQNKTVVFGCLGGYGRTGLLLGILFKCFDFSDNNSVVSDVRNYLSEHALETNKQEQFVLDFDELYIKKHIEPLLLDKLIIDCENENDYINILNILESRKKSIGPVNYSFIETIKLYDKLDLMNFLIKSNFLEKDKNYFYEGVVQKL